MAEKIVARLTPLMIFVGILAVFLILVTEDKLSFTLVISLLLLPIVLYHNKIELDNNILFVDSFFFIWTSIFQRIYVHRFININNIISINFSPYSFLIPFTLYFGDNIAISYISSDKKKKQFTVPLKFFPEFKNIVDEIIKKRPDLKK